jgi:hypothetical protein
VNFELGYIRVDVTDLADIVNEARRIMESAEEQRHATRANVQQWDDAVRRLEKFRTDVAALLGVHHLDDDTRLLDALRKLTTGKREWQCPACQEWVLGAELTCPTCTGEQAPTVAQKDTGADGERTGRFEPVPRPQDPDQDPGGWGLALTIGPVPAVPATPEPAHALVEPPTDAQVVSNLLSMVGVTVTADHIHDNWTLEQREQAADWAGSVHLSASDNDEVVVPERPAFLDSQEREAQIGDVAEWPYSDTTEGVATSG